jgi:TRAP-type C4-dicarboxylate transport system permease small subunit
MDFFEKLIHRSVAYGTNTGAVFLIAIMFVICANVIFRIFGRVIPGTYELVEIMVVVVAGFALSDTEIHHRQTTVDMVTTRLPRRIKLWLENVCHGIGLVYWAVIAWASVGITLDKAAKGETTDLLKISVIPFRVIWVIGLILICVVILYNTSRNWKELRRREK